MKKLFTLLAFAITVIASAQAPQGFNYQATVRNSSGALIINQNVYFKFNIMLNSQTSVPIYSETHYVPTDDLGQVNLVVGSGTATTGTFSAINWSSGTYFLGIELNTGSGYVAMGTTQLLSVPYALYANTSGNTQTHFRTSIYLTGDITNAQAAAKIAAELGPETENIFIVDTTQLTSVDLSAMVNAVEIHVQGNEVLTNVNLSGLTTVYKQLYFYENPLLISLQVQSLTNSYTFEVGNATTLNLSSLTKCKTLSISNITNFAPPTNLEKCSYMNIGSMPNMTSLSFPSLVSCTDGYININGNPQLTSISFPVLQSGFNFYLLNNALTSTNINSLLHKFLTVSPSVAKSIDLSNQNPLAPPTGQGLIDKQTLIDAGNNVTTDQQAILPLNWGIIGDATPTGWFSDTNMNFDPITNLYSITIPLIAGGSFKFRLDDAWTENYGDDGNDLSLDLSGANIPITVSGNYNIVVNFSSVDRPTMSAHHYSITLQ